jgi:CheY-like chemotaxis protein
MPFSRPIIILEDDSEDQEFLKDIFRELDILNPIRFFSSAITALDYFVASAAIPLLIICDINLPNMTGIEFKQEINKNQSVMTRAIPFVFLTTNPDAKLISKAYELNIQGYFLKPPTLIQLKEMIKTIVQFAGFCSRPVE